MKKINSKCSILKNFKNNPFLILNNKKEDLLNLLNQNYENFLKITNTQTIPINNISISDLSLLYFENKPPFEKSANKKSEFPDAIQLLSLYNHFKNLNEKIYIISNDDDIKNYCENNSNCLYLKSIEEFIRKFELFEKNYNKLNMKIDENIDYIIKEIKTKFLESTFIIDDAEGDVLEINVEEINIDEKVIFDIEKDSIKFLIYCNIKYQTDIEYINYDNAIYDKEDNDYYNLENWNCKVNNDDMVEVILSAHYSETDFKINDINFINNQLFNIYLSDNNDFYNDFR